MVRFVAILLLSAAIVSAASGVESLNVTKIGGIGSWRGQDVAISGNYAYVAAGNNGLRILDISDPTMIYEAGYLDLPGNAVNVVVEGFYAFIATGWGGVSMVDVSDPANPWEFSYYDDLPGHATDVALIDSRIYAAYSPGGVVVLETSQDGLVPIINLERESSFVAITASSSLVIASKTNNSTIFWDVPAGRMPEEIARINESFGSMQISGTHLIVCTGSYLTRYDISNLENLTLAGRLQFDVPSRVAVNDLGDKALVTARDGWTLVDLSRENELGVIYADPGQTTSFGVGFAGNNAIVVPAAGLEIFSLLNPRNPVRLGFACNLGNGVLGVEKVGDYAVSLGANMSVIDVSYPNRPIILSSIPMPGSPDPLKLVGPLAYIPCEDLRVYDLADPRDPALLGRFSTGNGMSNRDVDVEGTRAALINQDNLYLVDVTDPGNMHQLGHFQTANNVFFSNLDMEGDLIYAATTAGGMIYDASEPRYINRVGILDQTQGGCFDVLIDGPIAYVSAGPYYANDASLMIIDISDPLNSVQLGYCPIPAAPRSITKSGDWVYVADNWAGLQVIDVSDPERPERIGYWTEESDNMIGVAAFDRFVISADRYKGISIFQNIVSPTSAPIEGLSVPTQLILSAFPNPFNARASIQTFLPVSGVWSVAIYSSNGAEIARLADGWKSAGPLEVSFDAAELPAGSYFARVNGNGQSLAQRLILLK